MNQSKLTDDELQFIILAIEYWQDKEELINPSIDYVVDVNRLIEKLEDSKKEEEDKV